ncbi:sodium/proline symporter PutP [Clostridium sp. D2Q-11]|uniref:Sodium/proline symporter n=1 Tax=Anaeromonas frigoriresistens TaxID=2683708 RepID=A0A942V3T8_9FIRM|nr:sodium/proline symporter PutP [Anaeromonas frigoriresistens]MBS4539417.1 sodium/proline symporter PutP [Anaeromonas frigoriresistens]
MLGNSFAILVAFILYLGLMLGIGIYYYKKTTDLSDYVLGGRGLGSWVTAMSAQASDMSGWLLLGLPGAAYLSGLSTIWIALGLAVGTFLNWQFVATRLRKYTEIAGNSLTLSSYFGNRFRDDQNILRIVSSIIIVFYFSIYTASGLVAGGKLFSTVFGLDYTLALTIGAIVIVGYTFLGGFMAVSTTDFIQGIVMFIAIVAVPAVGIIVNGGPFATLDSIRSLNAEFLNPLTDENGNTLGLLAILSSFAWCLGYFGQPHILVRFMAIKSVSKIKKSKRIAMSWVIISLGAAILVGIVGRVIIPEVLVDSEQVFMVLIDDLLTSIIAGVFLSAVLAAIMSTADSQLLVTSSAFSEDLYKPLINKNASQNQLLMISRITVLAIALIAYIIALNPESSVLDIVANAWAGFGAAFGPVVLFSLFWKRMTKASAIAGMIIGGVTVFIWGKLSGGIFELYEMIPGFFLSCIIIVVVSLLGKEPSKDIQQEFESVVRSKS